jgi:hypothetical protein
MKKFLTAHLIVAAALLPVSVAGASSNPYSLKSLEAAAKAGATCNAAIVSGKIMTAKTVKACVTDDIIAAPVTACTHGPNVYEVSTIPDDEALIRVGYRPEVFTQANFYMSDGIQLCGDPIPAYLTPPHPAMTQAQVKAAYKVCERTNKCPVKYHGPQLP